MCINNCLEDGKQKVESMVYFHGELSSAEFQKIHAKTLDQNIYMGLGKGLRSEVTLGMLFSIVRQWQAVNNCREFARLSDHVVKWQWKLCVNKLKVMCMGENYLEIKCKMLRTRLLSLVKKILGL